MPDSVDEARPLALDVVTLMLNPRGDLWGGADWVTAAALLVDLSHRGRLEVTGAGRKLAVGARDPSPVGDDLLDEALQTIASRGSADRVVKLVKELPTTDRVLERLVADGTVTAEQGRKFGLLRATRHYPTPAAGREALMETAREAFRGDAAPDSRSAMLFSVLSICRELRAGVPEGQRNEVARQMLAVRDGIGRDEAALVSTIDNVVREINNSSNNSIF